MPALLLFDAIGAWGRNRTGTTLPSRDFKSLASTYSATQAGRKGTMEAAPGFEPGMKVLQTFALPLGDAALKLERETGFEPATLALARRCSTAELFPRMSEKIIFLPLPRALVKHEKSSLPLVGQLLLEYPHLGPIGAVFRVGRQRLLHEFEGLSLVSHPIVDPSH
jgi:hypothetical protein